MFFKRIYRLQTQFYLAYIGIIFLFVATFSLFFYYFVSQRLLIEEINTLNTNNASVQNAVEDNVNAMDTVAININYSSIVQSTLSYNFNLEQNEDSYKALADLFVMINGTDNRVNYIYLYDLQGSCLQVDSVQKLTQVDITTQPWYSVVTRNQSAPYISTPYEKKTGAYRQKSISLYRAYFGSDRQPLGIVETVKDCKTLFHSAITSEKVSNHSVSFYIYNENNELIYPYSSKAKNPNYPELENSRKLSGTGNNTALKVVNPLTDKTEYLSKLTSDYTGWTYYAVQEESVIFSPLVKLTHTLFIFVAILLIFAAILSHYLSRRLAHPIAHLKHIIQRMQLSNLGTEATNFSPVYSIELKELYDSFFKMYKNLKTSKDQLEKAQEAELESRTLALQSQMSPHFYYNSLSSIMILAENGDTEGVAGMCQNLSRIMRYATDFRIRVVSIQDELEYIKEYLYCMKMRNQSSLVYEINIDESLMDIRIPKLCIHPLVENALKYGTNCNPPWKICISSQITDDFWKIRVEDDGPGFTPEALTELDEKLRLLCSSDELPKLGINGLGLSNVYIRMAIYFENRNIFEYGNTKDGHAYITLGAYTDIIKGEDSR